MITLFAIGYFGYVFLGLNILSKIWNRYWTKSWGDPFFFFGSILWMALPFLIAADIYLEK